MRFKTNLKIVLYTIAFLWIVFFIDLILPVNLKQYGIYPGRVSSLTGILISPFLHADLYHLFFNSLALAALLFLSLLYDKKRSLAAVLIILVAGGLGVWVFGNRSAVHIGASGIIFGLIGWLLFCGIFKKDLMSVLYSLLVFFLYGGALLSFFRVTRGISWSAHFFGFLSGVLAAKVMTMKKNLN